VAVDNTFASPVGCRPLALGADYVMHSATKYIGGHGDAVGGVVCGRAGLIRPLVSEAIVHYGGVMSPFNAWLIARGAATLPIRMAAHQDTATAVARALETHPKIARVAYPGLESHPQHAIAARQMSGYGGMLSFALDGELEAVAKFLPRLRFAHRAANLGSVETIVGPPATTSHVECSPEERAALGIPEGLVRYSAGIEAIGDLLADLDQALDAV
jgi:cystathionine gamma-synthase